MEMKQLCQGLIMVLVFLVLCKYISSMMNREGYEESPEDQLTTENIDNPKNSGSLEQTINSNVESSEYNQDLVNSLDEEIVNSHQEYVNDSDFLATTGSSNNTERDDFNPPVKFHGLPRCAHYKQLGAHSDSRVQHSETAEDLEIIKGSCPNRYTL